MIKELKMDNGVECFVEDNGNIYSKYHKLLYQNIDNVGYHSVLLYDKDKKHHRYLVHRLVVMAFVNKDISRKDHVHHIDENKGNNNLVNLKIIPFAEHQKMHKQIYSYTKICKVCGKEFTPNPTKRKRAATCSKECAYIINKILHEKQKIKIDQYTKDNIFIKTWNSLTDIQNELGFANTNICKCCKGNINTAYGYIWRYHNAA